MIGYDYTHSNIGKDGKEYIMFMIEPERLDSRGLRNGRAINISIDHKKQTTVICRFRWIGGIPHDFELIKRLKGEVITDSEIPDLMSKLGIVLRKERLEE